MNVLELYSGIGGMHFALKASGVQGEIKASIDINPTANSVYTHNFPFTNLLNRNIQSLTPKFIKSLGVNTILMSPPCQPFTRNGLKGDVNDKRTNSFIHILNILPDLNIEKLLLENVKGFEVSQMRDMLIETLTKCDFSYREFILSPTQFGVPNSRHRYYCLAKKKPAKFTFGEENLNTEYPFQDQTKIEKVSHTIDQILDINEDISSYYLEDKILKKYNNILDICYSDSINSCCFTKAYGRYLEGTGSVFTDKTEEFIKEIYDKISNYDKDNEEYLKLTRQLGLRFFTPKEISRLMCFPETFSFPENLKNRQKYMLLGNSINVKVVSELIKLLQ